MQKNDITLSRFDKEKEIQLLRDEIDLLKYENETLKKQVSNLENSGIANFKQSQDERDAIIFYLEAVGNRISGIPSMVNFLRGFIDNVISSIKSAEHLNLDNYKKNNRRR
jgi:hypothetical protein